MSTTSLGLTGLLNELLEEQSSVAERRHAAGFLEEPRPHEFAADIAGASLDTEIEGLLSGISGLPAAAGVPALTAAAAATAPALPEASPASTPAPFDWSASGSAEAPLVSLASDANSDFRSYMEDGHYVADPLMQRPGSAESWGLYAVYDGHGGRSEVDYCEKQLHKVVVAELQSLAPGRDACRVLETTFKKIDGQLAMLGGWSSGCTATVVLLRRQGSSGGTATFHIANVGDSRAVLCGTDGVRRMTKDHHPKDPEEARRIVKDGGVIHNNRVGGKLLVSRSLGDHALKGRGLSCVPDTCSVSVVRGHILVMASDGLWDALSDADVRDELAQCLEEAKARGPDWLRETAAQTLVDRAKERGSRDNILVLAVFL
eukprot:TRINITY_DN25886_c0_g1_i2.p1 TRINITY_DN25886_c0_g1~~TRINITY_DN25886_c0_g1_i2.p1  ORF type:complete len:374 (-),score=57.71 TRINITY_DN25886_c0_g1_i2:233-1354(-)